MGVLCCVLELCVHSPVHAYLKYSSWQTKTGKYWPEIIGLNIHLITVGGPKLASHCKIWSVVIDDGDQFNSVDF